MAKRPEVKPPPPIEPGDLAEKENAGEWLDDLYADQKQRGRIERVRDVFHKAVLFALKWGSRLLFFLIASLAVVWWVHLVAPEKWIWLGEVRLKEVKSLLLNGALGALISSLGRKYL